jgi:hypothetical protein
MDFEISIQTWNGKWRYEVELEGEIVTNGILDTLAKCLDKCKEIVEEEQSYYDNEAAAISDEA